MVRFRPAPSMASIPPAAELLVGVAGVVVALVAPLYILVLDIREDLGAASTEREHVTTEQDDLANKIEGVRREVREVRQEVNEVSLRSEMNQKHIHDLILSNDRETEAPTGTAPHPEGECPFNGQCPWHGDMG